MNRRAIAIGIFVFGIIMLGIVGLLYLQSQNADNSNNNNNQEPPPVQVNEEGTPIATTEGELPPEQIDALSSLPAMVEVVVSLQTVPRGWLITEAELTTDMRVSSEIPSNVIIRPEDAIGRYARTDIFQGETLTYEDLVEDITLIGAYEYGPSSLVPPGFIAMSVPMDRLSSVAYGLEAGDYTDIMITFSFYQIDEQFQTYLPNAGVLFLDPNLEVSDPPPVDQEGIIILDPLGRFEELPTGELVFVSPSQAQNSVPIAMVLQNARVIQVGAYEPRPAAEPPTPTPEPAEEGEPTPTPGGAVDQATATPEAPQVIVVALQPQQQLFLKYALEVNANVDFALRGVNDGQLYEIQNIDLSFFLERYNIEVPPNFNYSVENILVTPTGQPTTPASSGGGGGDDAVPPPEGG
jgi:pilus assembly protein CpaB